MSLPDKFAGKSNGVKSVACRFFSYKFLAIVLSTLLLTGCENPYFIYLFALTYECNGQCECPPGQIAIGGVCEPKYPYSYNRKAGVDEFDVVLNSLTNIPINNVCQSFSGGFDCLFGGISSRVNTALQSDQVVTSNFAGAIIVQMPGNVSDFSGFFRHIGSGTTGNPVLAGGLSSLAIDSARTLNAEPGTQFVVFGFPPGAQTTGEYFFSLEFVAPPGTTTIQIKPIITGFVQLTNGVKFYPPLMPCVDNMANAFPINLNAPPVGQVANIEISASTIPQTPGCNNVSYNFSAANLTPITSGNSSSSSVTVPTLSEWSLVALATVLGGIGRMWSRHRK